MVQIRVSDDVISLLKMIKAKHAVKTGDFVPYDEILKGALEDYEQPDDEYEDDEDDYT